MAKMKEMVEKELMDKIDILDAVQLTKNEGRGISCVKDMIKLVRMGYFDEAQAIRQWDGDKTRSYLSVEKLLTEIFGCRSHGNYDCHECYEYEKLIGIR